MFISPLSNTKVISLFVIKLYIKRTIYLGIYYFYSVLRSYRGTTILKAPKILKESNIVI